MSDILLFWVGLIVAFIIIEFFTSMFYGFALALSAGVVALYVFILGDGDFQMVQALIFAIASAIFAYLLPKYLISGTPDMPQGGDRYIGEKRNVKKAGGDLKISLDGVDYLIDSSDDIAAGDRVEVLGHKGASMKVKKI